MAGSEPRPDDEGEATAPPAHAACGVSGSMAAPNHPPPTTPDPAPTLSKNAQKRRAKAEKWEALKPVLKAQRKDRLRRIKEARRAARHAEREHDEHDDKNDEDEDDDGDDGSEHDGESSSKRIRIDPSLSQAEDGKSKGQGKGKGKGRAKAKAKAPKRVFGATCVLDLGFDTLMSEKEIKSLAHQLTFVYASVRHARAPFRDVVLVGQGPDDRLPAPSNVGPSSSSSSSSSATLAFSSSVLAEKLEARTHGSWKRWRGIRTIEEGGLAALWATQQQAGNPASQLRPEDVIYLTADSENEIDALEEGKAYVLGGIVDHNRYKDLCLHKAEALGVRTARLPISDALFNASDDEDDDDDGDDDDAGQGKMEAEDKTRETAAAAPPVKLQSRKVLTVNQVVEILLGWTEQHAEALLAQDASTNTDAADKPAGSGAQAGGDENGGASAKSGSRKEHWWRAAVKRAFPRRKLKDRSQRRRRRRNEEDAAAAAARLESLPQDLSHSGPVSDLHHIHAGSQHSGPREEGKEPLYTELQKAER